MALHTVHDDMQSYEVHSDMKLTKNFVGLGESQDSIIENVQKNKRNKKYLQIIIVGEEVKDIPKKRRFLTPTIEDLIKDADKYTLDATKKKYYQLLKQSSDLRSFIKAKEDGLSVLDKVEESLSVTKKNV